MTTQELQATWNEFIRIESEAAFDCMYQYYYNYFSFIGLKRGHSPHLVKDIINKVFLHLWEKRQNLTHISNPHSYLVTVFIRNICKEDKPASWSHLNEMDSSYLPHFQLPSTEDHFIQNEHAQKSESLIRQYLEQLPPQQRSMLYQKFFLDLSYQEIAVTNGVSVNTVYNTVYAALNKLRTLIPKDVLLSFIFICATVCA